jgi:hypothetical protein
MEANHAGQVSAILAQTFRKFSASENRLNLEKNRYILCFIQAFI